MSTKTIKQRIALVAVSALTAGLFTVVSAPAAKAESGAWLGTSATLILHTRADADGTPDVPTGTISLWVVCTVEEDKQTRGMVWWTIKMNLGGTPTQITPLLQV